MRIKRLELKNFKRFTDLVIENIPETAKLVLLIGANGSGKSSVFDGFEALSNYSKHPTYPYSKIIVAKSGLGFAESPEAYSYYKKNEKSFDINILFANGFEFGRYEEASRDVNLPPNAFYGRSSLRQVPRLLRKSLGQKEFSIETDSDRPNFYIDRDERFENDLELVINDILNAVFKQQNAQEVIQSYVKPINDAFYRIFGSKPNTSLQLKSIIPPLDNNTFQVIFQKGNSEIHYNLLSSGEKEIFNILINLLTRRQYYQDTIYFFDEMDLHLNTALQEALLREITENWIPENCQLWTASHSLGFIKYANESPHACIIDFDNYDFDQAQVLLPQPKDDLEVFEIAVGKEYLPVLFKNINIYFVENKDRDYYASVGIQQTVFISENNRNSVYHKVKTGNYYGLVDRDFLSDDDITQIKEKYTHLKILNYYSIENYFYHPDNLAEYYQTKVMDFSKTNYINALIEEKNKIKASIIPSLALKRTEYPYFGEPTYEGKPLQNRFKNRQENFDESEKIAAHLESNELEVFYKSLPMKTYCKQIPDRQNIKPSDLAKTRWFKKKIEEALQ